MGSGLQPTPCPACGGEVLEADNRVRLDWPSTSEGDWHLIPAGNHSFAATGGQVHPALARFTLHDHQPPEP